MRILKLHFYKGGGHMEVVYLPRTQPAINGGKNNYRPGDLVNVNCTSAASKPAGNIKFFNFSIPTTLT